VGDSSLQFHCLKEVLFGESVTPDGERGDSHEAAVALWRACI